MNALRLSVAAALLLAVLIAVLPGSAAEPEKKAGPAASEWDRVVDKAIAYLKEHQGADGAWSEDQEPRRHRHRPDRNARNAARSPPRTRRRREGAEVHRIAHQPQGRPHRRARTPRCSCKNYVTCINVMALQAADRDSYKQVVEDAVKFLKNLQWDEGEGKDPKDDFYGGAGYDSKSRPDLSNTQFFIDSLIAAGVSKDDPALKKALIFVSRCQNFKGEGSDQPWQDKINDGSFIYSPAAGGQTKTQDQPGDDGSLPGYGSMTYAGIKSMIYCGVDKNDPRVKRAFEWIQKNYSVEKNPGMPDVRSNGACSTTITRWPRRWTLMGVDEIKDADGKKHDWRAEITAALAKLQKPDGSWVNNDHWMESDPNLLPATP